MSAIGPSGPNSIACVSNAPPVRQTIAEAAQTGPERPQRVAWPVLRRSRQGERLDWAVVSHSESNVGPCEFCPKCGGIDVRRIEVRSTVEGRVGSYCRCLTCGNLWHDPADGPTPKRNWHSGAATTEQSQYLVVRARDARHAAARLVAMSFDIRMRYRRELATRQDSS